MARRRLAGREANLALGPRDAGQRIDQQEHAGAPPIAEPLGDRGRDLRRAHPDQARRVGGGAHRDGSIAARREVGGERLAELAAALTDQARHHHVGVGAARELAEQRRLADARPGEQPDPLALGERAQAVDRPHAGAQRHELARSLERGRRRPIDGPRLTDDRRAVVDRRAEAVEHAAEQAVAAGDLEGPAGAPHRRARRQAAQLAERQQRDVVAGEAHHLGTQRRGAGAAQVDDLAEHDVGQPRPHQQADHAGDLAGGGVGRDAADLDAQRGARRGALPVRCGDDRIGVGRRPIADGLRGALGVDDLASDDAAAAHGVDDTPATVASARSRVARPAHGSGAPATAHAASSAGAQRSRKARSTCGAIAAMPSRRAPSSSTGATAATSAASGRDGPSAVEALSAAEVALAQGDLDRAAKRLAEVPSASAAEGAPALVRALQAELALARGHRDEAQRAVRAAERPGGDEGARARFLIARAAVEMYVGDVAAARTSLGRAAAQVGAGLTPALRAAIECQRASCLSREGRLGEAEAAAAQAEQLARTLDDVVVADELRLARARVTLRRGDATSALAELRHLVATRRARGDELGATQLEVELAEAQVARGDLVPAVELASAVHASSTRLGLAVLAARIYRVGILMYGKRPTVRELMRWMRKA